MSIHPHNRFSAPPRAVAQAYVKQRRDPMRATLVIVADIVELVLAAAMAVGFVLALIWSQEIGAALAELF